MRDIGRGKDNHGRPYIPGMNCDKCGRFVGKDGDCDPIRLAVKEDVEKIVEYVDKSGMVFHSKRTIQRMVCGDNEGRKPYVIGLAHYQDEIIGIAIVSAKSKTLSLVFVSEGYRNSGIGKKLLEITSPKQLLVKIDSLGYFCKVYITCQRGIDPPTGEELGRVLTSYHKIPEEGLEAQIIRWKWSE